MNNSLNKIIKTLLFLYITFMTLLLIAYGSCFFIDKFANYMISNIESISKGYSISIDSLTFEFPVALRYLDLLTGGFFIPEILIVISGFIYLKFMNGKYGYSLSIEKLQFIKKLILTAYILKCLIITSNRVHFSLTENLWLLIVLFLLEKDIIIAKNMYDKHWEKVIKEETTGEKE